MNNRNIQELKEDRLCVFGEDYDEICCCYKSRNDDSMNLNSKFKSILLSFGARNSIDDEPNFEVFHTYNTTCPTPDTISSEISNDLVSLDSILIDQIDNDCIYYENILNHNQHSSNSNETNNDYNNYELFTSPSPSPSSSTNDNFNDFNVKFHLSSFHTDDIYDDFCEVDNCVSDLNSTTNVHVQMPNSNVGEEEEVVVTKDESENKSDNNDSTTPNVINSDSSYNSDNNTLVDDDDDDDDQNLLITNQHDNIEIKNELTTTTTMTTVTSDKEEQPIVVVKPVKRELNDRLKMFLENNCKPYQISKSIKLNDNCEESTTTTTTTTTVKSTSIRKTTFKLNNNNNKLLDTKKVDWLKEILKSNNRIK